MVRALRLNKAAREKTPLGNLASFMDGHPLKSHHTPAPVHFPQAQQAIVLEVTLMNGFVLIS